MPDPVDDTPIRPRTVGELGLCGHSDDPGMSPDAARHRPDGEWAVYIRATGEPTDARFDDRDEALADAAELNARSGRSWFDVRPAPAELPDPRSDPTDLPSAVAWLRHLATDTRGRVTITLDVADLVAALDRDAS